MKTINNQKKKADGDLGSDLSADLFSGFIKLHILHHASDQPVYGLWLIEELSEHGYRIGPGTLYPLLHSLEEAAMLQSRNETFAGKIRRYYRITPKGRKQLKRAKLQLLELMGEIMTPEELRLGSRMKHSRAGKE